MLMLPGVMADEQSGRSLGQRVFPLVWIALALFLVLRAGGRDRGVIEDHREFGRRLVAGEELYAPYLEAKPLHPVYPPSFGLLTAPFATVDLTTARYAWAAAQVAALWVILLALARALARHAPHLVGSTHGIALLALVVTGRYVLRDTHGGGGNLINLAFAIAAYAAAERKRTLAAALLLGFSLATKPTMALLVPVMFALGQVRVAWGSCVAALGFVALALGLNGHGIEPLSRWFEGSLAYGSAVDLFAPPHLELPPFSWMNQSLRCMVVRYFGVIPDEFAALVPGFVPGLGLPHLVTAWIARVLSIAVLAITLRAAWRARADVSRRDFALVATLAAGTLLSPISWKAHHVALLPAIFVAAAAAWNSMRGARIGLAAFFVLCSAGGGDLVGDAAKEWQQSLYLATFGAGALWWVMAHRAAQPR